MLLRYESRMNVRFNEAVLVGSDGGDQFDSVSQSIRKSDIGRIDFSIPATWI